MDGYGRIERREAAKVGDGALSMATLGLSELISASMPDAGSSGPSSVCHVDGSFLQVPLDPVDAVFTAKAAQLVAIVIALDVALDA